MASIAWGSWQDTHITKRHGVSASEFDVAWHDPYRQDLAKELHEEHGPYYVSVGYAAPDRPLKMVWRWHRGPETVWPITAFVPSRGARRRTGKR